ncbi:MAG: methionyl-tRNA formyltransferase [Chitinophagales bacterium]|nr:methionyl-tRNA formyltransferase [Chitinophagales bacterium]
MGTPEFAVPMLDTLINSEHEVVGVITAPDKPAGRGMQLIESDVKKFAKEKGLNILQPEKLKNEAFLTELKTLNADLFVVVAFRMLPEVVWSMPRLGTINLHASLLPQYRGAAPINWALINGEKETGVSTFFIQHEIDTGKIIYQEKIAIREDDNVGELYAELMQLGANVLRKTEDAIAANNYPQIPQDHITDIKHAPKIFKETCRIDFSKDADYVYNFIRGLSPYPAAFTMLNGKVFKIYRAAKRSLPGVINTTTGYETDGKTFLLFNCNGGAIDVKECQLEGKKKMSIEEFLRGNKLA